MVANFNRKGNREFFNEGFMFRAVGILFLVVVCILVVVDFRIYQKKRELSAQTINYQKRIEDIKKSSQTLKDEIANSDNKDYLEKLAYEQLGQQKPGEKQVIFIMPKESPTTVSRSTNFWDVKFWTGWLANGFNWLKSKF